jgi:hypothetical protein
MPNVSKRKHEVHSTSIIHAILWVSEMKDMHSLLRGKKSVDLKSVVQYVDRTISATLHNSTVLPGQTGNLVPNPINPSTTRAPVASENDPATIERVNHCASVLQIHAHHKSCVKRSLLGGKTFDPQDTNFNNKNCRYHFPRPIKTNTEINVSPAENALRATVKLDIKRNHEMLNNFNPLILSVWGANMDVSLLVESYAAAVYVGKYLSKLDVADTPSITTEMAHALGKLDDNASLVRQLIAVANTSIGCREMSQHESLLISLGYSLVQLSHEVVRIDVRIPKPADVTVNNNSTASSSSSSSLVLADPALIARMPDDMVVTLDEGTSPKSKLGHIINYEKRPLSCSDMSLFHFTTHYRYHGKKAPLGKDDDSVLDDDEAVEDEGDQYEYTGDVDNIDQTVLKLLDGRGYMVKRKSDVIVESTPHTKVDLNSPESCYMLLLFYYPFVDRHCLPTLPQEIVNFFRDCVDRNLLRDVNSDELNKVVIIQQLRNAPRPEQAPVPEFHDIVDDAIVASAVEGGGNASSQQHLDLLNWSAADDDDLQQQYRQRNLDHIEIDDETPLNVWSQQEVFNSVTKANSADAYAQLLNFVSSSYRQWQLGVQNTNRTEMLNLPAVQQKFEVDVQQLNEQQELVLNIVKEHVKDKKQLLMIVHGAGGTGKSFVCNQITQFCKLHYYEQLSTQEQSELFRNQPNVDSDGGAGEGGGYEYGFVIIAAPTGCAAKLIGGETVHRIFSFIEYGSEMTDKQAANSRRLFKHVKMLIIDEVSMLSLKMIDQVNKRLQLIMQKKVAFGGVHVVLFGDFYQIPPVNGAPVWQSGDEIKTNIDRNGRTAWLMFNVVIELTQQQRQIDPEAQPFAELLMRARCGSITQDDINLLNRTCLMSPSIALDTHPGDPTTVWIAATNPKVANINRLHLVRCSMDKPVINIWALHYTSSNDLASAFVAPSQHDKDHNELLSLHRSMISDTALAIANAKGKVSPSNVQKLAASPTLLQLTIGSRVTLKRNQATGIGLVNGALGTVVGFVYNPALPEQTCRPDLSKEEVLSISYFTQIPVVLVKFDQRFYSNQMPSCCASSDCVVPIIPVDTNFQLSVQNKKIVRYQLPLAHGWGMTMHKVQGQTLEHCVVDPSGIFNRGMAYVACSRVRSINGLHLIESITLQSFRFGHNSKGSKQLNAEIKRLGELQKTTKLKDSVGTDAPLPIVQQHASVNNAIDDSVDMELY